MKKNKTGFKNYRDDLLTIIAKENGISKNKMLKNHKWINTKQTRCTAPLSNFPIIDPFKTIKTMYLLSKTINKKTIYLKDFYKGTIETTENKAEAMQFESKAAAEAFARQTVLTLTWRATPNE